MLCIPDGQGRVIVVFESCSSTVGFFPAKSFDARTWIITEASKTQRKAIAETKVGRPKRWIAEFIGTFNWLPTGDGQITPNCLYIFMKSKLFQVSTNLPSFTRPMPMPSNSAVL